LRELSNLFSRKHEASLETGRVKGEEALIQ
jgi:hypothetical protein